jgi:NAD(P)-dependent dehydrogenase (short-subunit alcohol dehydrogenase family)
MDLSGKVLVVTGADGALGQAVAATLGAYGATLALLSRAAVLEGRPSGDAQRGDARRGDARRYGGIDLTVEASARTAMERIAQDSGRIDGLINIAGGFRFEKVREGTIDSWDAMYKINLRTAVISCQAALPYLLRSASARIVNVGAMGAQKASAGMGPYAASKAGVAQLTEALADELKERGVTVNAILPTTLDTPKNRADMPHADFKRWVTLSEAAEVIAFLVSDQASAVTGALIPVAGRA